MIFELKRLLYQTCTDSMLHIYPVAPYALESDALYTAWVRPVSGFRSLDQARRGRPIDSEKARLFDVRLALNANGGALRLSVDFPQEDHYALTICANGREIETLFLLALDEDLFYRFPFKGNLRLHSFYSDGIESPECVAAHSRMLGLDFVAISDPMQYAPSKRAVSFLAPLGIDFLVLRGEEIRIPENPFPIVAVGHQASVGEWRRRNIGQFETEVAKKRAAIEDPLPDQTKYAIAAGIILLEKIKEEHGLSVLALPQRYDCGSPFDIADYLFEHRLFDAFELIGDLDAEEAQCVISYYQEKMAFPVVGGSRENTRDCAPPRYTIVFAPQLTTESILQSIREGYAVAGCGNTLHGPYRLVRAAYFFLRHIFPRHDVLCAIQGRKLVSFVGGKAETDPDFSDQFASIGSLVTDYYKGLKG